MGEQKRKIEAMMTNKLTDMHDLLDRWKREVLKRYFPSGTWVFGIRPHKGCSEVIEVVSPERKHALLQPFDYLNDYDITHYRAATPAEVMEAMDRVMEQRLEKENAQ